MHSASLTSDCTRPTAGSARVVSLVVLILAALTGYFYSVGSEPEQTPAPADTKPVVEDSAGKTEPPIARPVPVAVPTWVSEPTTDEQTRMIKMPNGKWYPNLNGVVGAPPVKWPKGKTYSPINGTRIHDGVQWYTHEDGSISTTRYMFRDDLGRDDATTIVSQVTYPETPPALVDGQGNIIDSKPANAGDDKSKKR